MSGVAQQCATDRRRSAVRAAGWNGVTDVEVSEDRLHLCVHFLGGVPEDLRPANVRIEGGRRIRDIAVVSLRVRPPGDTDDEECLELTLDRAGDPSDYQVCVIELDERGRPTGRPYPGFDVRYQCVGFRFTVDCPSPLDCAPGDDCPPPDDAEPLIDYLVRDYEGFRRLLLDRMALLVPDWSERHVPDLGVTLVELLASVADQLAYAQDAVATEAYLGTALRRVSIRRHARLVDYVLSEGCNARAFVALTLDGAASWTPAAGELTFLTAFAGEPELGRLLDADRLPVGRYECYEPVAGDPTDPIRVLAARNTMALWTWGDQECCLPTGSTSAWLVDLDRELGLEPGDLVVFEEALGPRTGDPADADGSHRQVVRLTSATEVVDELFDVPLLEVTWAPADALTFPLCLSSIGPAPGCAPLDQVSVARGNVVLVDHGRRVGPEPLDPVPDPVSGTCCEGPCLPADVIEAPTRYRPGALVQRPVTFAGPPRPTAPASTAIEHDPRSAVAALGVTSVPADPATGAAATTWLPQQDLLASAPGDAHVAVEIDDEGAAHLRFGDDRLGMAPSPGDRFAARYRVGNGRAGNTGAETIVHVARRGPTDHGLTIGARNPLPASGGTDPEPTAQAKLLAPRAFRSLQERAIVADDYAALARREAPELQAAGAALRWTGSWYEVLVSADERGRAEPDPDLLAALAARLDRYRRMGHDVVVAPARPVPLKVVLSVCVAPHHRRSVVIAALGEVFSSRTTGGLFHPDRLVPGGPIASSVLTAAAQAVEGVESVEVVVLRRLFDRDDAVDLPADRVLRLGPDEVARADSDPIDPDGGSVDFDVRGGR